MFFSRYVAYVLGLLNVLLTCMGLLLLLIGQHVFSCDNPWSKTIARGKTSCNGEKEKLVAIALRQPRHGCYLLVYGLLCMCHLVWDYLHISKDWAIFNCICEYCGKTCFLNKVAAMLGDCNVRWPCKFRIYNTRQWTAKSRTHEASRHGCGNVNVHVALYFQTFGCALLKA